jgi:Xaa-Pro aminopeptidase
MVTATMPPYAERRRRVLDAIQAVAIVFAAPLTVRNGDVEHEWRQDSDLYWLTGFHEPDAVLLLSKVHAEHRSVMFVRPRDKEREAWEGPRAGVEGAVERFGVDAAFPIDELGKRLPEYLTGAAELVYELGRSPELDARVAAAITQARARGRTPKPWPRSIVHPETVLHELRLVKDASEIALVRQAVAITAEAHLGAMRAGRAGRHEYEIDALIREVFGRNGAARAAFSPTVGSGPNGTVLHYHCGRRRLEPGELVLVDAGCEYEYYAADVTRTFPVDGRFAPAQRAIYEVVLAAELAGIARARPGATIEDIHRTVQERLVDGLLALGLCQGARDEIIAAEGHKRYTIHRTSHWLGMDVHDVGAYFVAGEARPLAPGMILTIEPGLYVPVDDEQAPAEMRGIGVRIEDDVLITADGHENLSAAVPKTIAEVEQACRA